MLQLWSDVGFVDLFDYVPGYPDEDPQQFIQSSTEVDGLGFVSIDWLRKMKQKAARTKDLADLENLPE